MEKQAALDLLEFIIKKNDSWSRNIYPRVRYARLLLKKAV